MLTVILLVVLAGATAVLAVSLTDRPGPTAEGGGERTSLRLAPGSDTAPESAADDDPDGLGGYDHSEVAVAETGPDDDALDEGGSLDAGPTPEPEPEPLPFLDVVDAAAPTSEPDHPDPAGSATPPPPPPPVPEPRPADPEPAVAVAWSDPGPPPQTAPRQRDGRRSSAPVPRRYTAVEGSYRDVARVPILRRFGSLVTLVVVLVVVGVGVAAVFGALIAAASELLGGAVG